MGSIKFLKNKLLLVEGKDALNFFIWALAAYKIENIQIFDFGGIGQLTRYLAMLQLVEGYEKIETIIIARDAETDADGAINSIKGSLKQASLSAPKEPFEYINGTPRVCYMLFPGRSADGNLQKGALEDLCLNTIQDDVMSETDTYLTQIETNHHTLTHKHKSKLYAYLAVKNHYVGAKLGEAAKYGAWDWNSEVMNAYKEILLNA